MKQTRDEQLDAIRSVFSRNVKLLRERKGWTQAELAELLGVHRTTIVRIETGVHQPLFSEACLLADILGASIAEMRIEVWGGR